MHSARLAVAAFLLVVFCAPFVWAKGGGTGRGGSSSGGKGSTSSGSKTVFVNSYTRKDGTFVQAHYRSAPRTAVHVDARVTARISAPIIVVPEIHEVERFTPPAVSRPSSSSTGSRASSVDKHSASSSASPQRKGSGPVVIVVPEDDETIAARMLAFAKEIAQSAAVARSERRAKDAGRLEESAWIRYGEVVRKYPATAAAKEAKRLMDAM